MLCARHSGGGAGRRGSGEHAPRLLVSQTVPLLTEVAYKSPNAFKKPSLLRDIRTVAARNVTRPSDA